MMPKVAKKKVAKKKVAKKKGQSGVSAAIEKAAAASEKVCRSKPALKKYVAAMDAMDWQAIEDQCFTDLVDSFERATDKADDERLGGMVCQWENMYFDGDLTVAEIYYWTEGNVGDDDGPIAGGIWLKGFAKPYVEARQELDKPEDAYPLLDWICTAFVRTLGHAAQRACATDAFAALPTAREFWIAGCEHDGFGCNIGSGDKEGLAFVAKRDV